MANVEDKRCAKCNKMMGADFASFGLNALGKAWHKDCFNCKYCGKKIFSFAKFHNEDGFPVCVPCNNSAATMCGACRKPCTSGHVKAMNKDWHEECFHCAGCKKRFGDEGFFEDENKLWHLECYSASIK